MALLALPAVSKRPPSVLCLSLNGNIEGVSLILADSPVGTMAERVL